MLETRQNASDNYIPALTGLRAVAAFLVFFSHFPIPSKRLGTFFTDFCSELYIGVSIFFVLSGFLIALRYADNFTYSLRSFLEYMKKRFARIYPMYFILTTLTFLYHKIDPSFKPFTYFLSTPEASAIKVYFLNITFLKGFLGDVVLSGIGQGWTLTVEESFYLVAPFILLLRNRIPLIVHIAVLYLVGFMLVFLCKDLDLLGLFKSNKFMMITTFFGRCLEFYVGIQLALWYRNNKTPIAGGRITYLGILSIFVVVCILITTRDPNAEHNLGLYSSKGMLINNFILPFVIGLLFVGLLREKTFVRTILETRLAVLLGKSSYVLYLIHMGLISELLYQYVTHNYILNFPFLIVLSVILYKFVENPLNNLIRKI